VAETFPAFILPVVKVALATTVKRKTFKLAALIATHESPLEFGRQSATLSKS
jgi:hypothetical protein